MNRLKANSTILRAAVALAVLCVASAPAWANGSVIFQLKSDLMPVTDFAVVRVTMQATNPAQMVFIEEHIADAGIDYEAGARIAEFISVPFDTYRAVMELFNADGYSIDSRSTRIRVDDDFTQIVTMGIYGGSPPSDPYYHLTHWTSEEKPRAECKPHTAAVGLECHGSFCDNIRLECNPLPGGLGTERWTPFFSEENPGLQGCLVDEFVTGLECKDTWCDEISLRCAEIPGTVNTCKTSGPVSDETGAFHAEDGYFLQRMSCSGSFCDNKDVETCNLHERLWSMRLFFDLCVSVEGWPGGEIEPGKMLFVAPCRDSETGNDDQRWVLGADGTIFNVVEQMCMALGANGVEVELCDGTNSQRWRPDSQNRLANLADPTLCLSVDHPGEPWQHPGSWRSLLFEPCADGADQMWALPGMSDWIFADGFDSGDVTRWFDARP